jgi:MFS transporter, DHA2 family, multidrug resistance protein
VISDEAAAQHKAVVAIGLRIRQQANIMAFSDTFFLLGAALVVAIAFTLALKKADASSGGPAH